MLKYIMAAAVTFSAFGLTPVVAQTSEAAPVKAEITKEGDVTAAITLENDKASLRLERKVWQAVILKTPAGRQLRITDPLLYFTQVNDKPSGQDAYWTKPENWDSQLSFQVVERPDAPQGAATILIEGKRPGLLKQVYVTQYPGDPAVYVVNRIQSEEAVRISDVHLVYLARAADNSMHVSEMTIDEAMVDADTKVPGRRGVFAYLGTSDASIGVAIAPARVQKAKMRDLILHLPQKTGREIRIHGLAGQEVKPGEMVEIRYALYWGDGHLIREVHSWIKEVADGQHNDRFYPAAQPR